MKITKQGINPEPVTRDEFEALLNQRLALQRQLVDIGISITVAKARGVEPVTRDNVRNEWTMMLLKRARSNGNHAVVETVESLLERREQSALPLVIEALNAEAQ